MASHKAKVDMVINFSNETLALCATTLGFREHTSQGVSPLGEGGGPRSKLVNRPH